jgi:hypothetical protein
MTIKVWTEWIPRWAPPHIKGKHEPRVFTMGMPEEQRVECECLHCGAVWKGVCSSGNARRHIQRFALVHLHGKLTTDNGTFAPDGGTNDHEG